jgi:hypothetical protein
MHQNRLFRALTVALNVFKFHVFVIDRFCLKRSDPLTSNREALLVSP